MLYAVIILGIVFIPFFIYKTFRLSEYNKYTGKVIAIEKVNIKDPYNPAHKRFGYVRHIPVVEYYIKKDTSSFSEGTLNYFSFYKKGDEVTYWKEKMILIWHIYILFGTTIY